MIFFLIVYFIFKSKGTTEPANAIINPHTFKFTINPARTVCGVNQGANVILVSLVEVSPTAVKERQQIRETWGNSSLFKLTRTVFLLGLSKNETINKLIVEESKIYKDIVQEDFLDSYKNLTIKTIMGFKWVSEYCSNAKFVLKTDDDAVINTAVVERYLQTVPDKNLYMGYYLYTPPVIRNKFSKFYVSESEYNASHFNSYQIGVGYYVSLDLARKFFEMSLYTSLFKFEDVYVGMLAKKLNIKGKQIAKLYSMNNVKSVKYVGRLTKKNNTILLAYATMKNFRQIWSFFYNLSFSDIYSIKN